MNIDHRIEVVDIRPGDVLFVKTDRRLSVDQARQLTDHIKDKFPNNEVVVLQPELSLGVVREDPAE